MSDDLDRVLGQQNRKRRCSFKTLIFEPVNAVSGKRCEPGILSDESHGFGESPSCRRKVAMALFRDQTRQPLKK